MADHNYYEVTNGHNQREITIVNVALLVGKAPTKEKRIRIKVRDVLSGHPNMGAPDWLSAAAIFVGQWHDPVYPAIDFKGYDFHFSADNLFGAEGVKSPRGQMRGFEITEFGPSEEPDVVANFTLYAPFSTALWSYLGQYGGDSVWCSFTPGLGESGEPEDDGDDVDDEDEDQELDPDNETEAGEDDGGEDDTVLEEPDDPRLALEDGAKHGPKDLKEFHEKELEKAAKPPKTRTPKGFGKPLNPHHEF
jgi:hypothetical protein